MKDHTDKPIYLTPTFCEKITSSDTRQAAVNQMKCPTIFDITNVVSNFLVNALTLKVLVVTIDALGHFETG